MSTESDISEATTDAQRAEVQALFEGVFHHIDGDPESIESTFVTQIRQWFDSVWNSVATEVTQ